MQQKVPFVSSLFQHRFASLNTRFRSIFRALSGRCIYSPLSPRVHRPRCHLWSLLLSRHHFRDLIILPWSFNFVKHSFHVFIYPSLSPLLLSGHYFTIRLPFCHHFPIFTVNCHVIIFLIPILILKPPMKNQGDGQQSRVTGPSSKVHLCL
jgi:hypothetical protein